MNVRVEVRALAVCSLVIASALSAAEIRTWVSRDGQHTVKAELTSAGNGKAVLLRDDGMTVEVPFQSLSADDLNYVAARFPGSGATLALPPPAPRMEPPPGVTPANVESAAAACRTARDAWAVVRTYYRAFPPDAASQFSVDSGLTKWRQLAEQKQFRLGRKWVSQSDVLAARRAALELVQGALVQLEAKNGDEARKALIEASKADPDWPLPNCLIGLVYAVGMRDYDQAKMHFAEALQRDPNDPAVLNNLALVELRNGNATAAVSRWTQAAEFGPSSSRILHNMLHFFALVDGREIPEPTSGMNVARTLQQALKEQTVVDAHGRNGWYYVPPLTVPEASAATAGQAARAPGETMLVGREGGFVIAPNYVLSFCDAPLVPAEVYVTLADGATRPRAARVVAHDEQYGLLLIEAQGIGGRPAELSDRFPRPGADVTLAGVSKPAHYSDPRLAVRGTLLSMPAAETGDMFLCQATAAPGEGAAPIADATGRIIGAAVINQRIGKPLSFAVSNTAITTFVAKHLPEFKPVAGDAAQRQWKDVDRDLRESLVLVESRMEMRYDLCEIFEKLKDDNPIQIFGDTALEDVFCNRCRGWAAVDCPNTACANGGVLVGVPKVTGRLPNGDELIRVDKVRVSCNYCSGRGKVRCPNCAGGRAVRRQ